jgi:hypothetical protein
MTNLYGAESGATWDVINQGPYARHGALSRFVTGDHPGENYCQPGKNHILLIIQKRRSIVQPSRLRIPQLLLVKTYKNLWSIIWKS